MGMFDSFNISATGLTAQRLRMDVISDNVANATTTRTPEGDGPYVRKRAIFAPVNIRPRYKYQEIFVIHSLIMYYKSHQIILTLSRS